MRAVRGWGTLSRTSVSLSMAAYFAAVAAGQGDDVHIAFVCGFDGFDDVGGIAGGGNADEDVACTSERAHLFAEYVVETVVVADGGQRGGVCGQGDGGEFHAFFLKTPGHFGGEVLRVGSRTAVAAGQDFAVVHQALQHQLGSLYGRLDQYFFGFLFGTDAFGKMCGNAFL